MPIVFAQVADPVGAGFVDSLARPGGNTTGFMQFESGLSGKWLELLKEIAPGVDARRPSSDDPGTARRRHRTVRVIQAVASSLGVELSPINVRDAADDRARHHRVCAAAERRPDRGWRARS